MPAILSSVLDLGCVVIRKRHRENRDNQYYQATTICPYFGWLITSRCVWRDNRAKDCVNSSK